MARIAGERVTLNPDPKLGPVIISLLQEGSRESREDAIALTRLAISGTYCRVIERRPDYVVVRVRGSRRRFVLPVEVVKTRSET